MSSFGGTTTANGPSSTTEQAKEKAQEAAQQAKRSVRDQVDQRSTEAGERVGSTAQDARSVGEELRRQGKDQPAKLAEQAAERAESLGDYLERSDGDTILRDLEDFGRRQPWAVIAGGVALGFAASRFLKASSTPPRPSSAADARTHQRRADDAHRARPATPWAPARRRPADRPTPPQARRDRRLPATTAERQHGDPADQRPARARPRRAGQGPGEPDLDAGAPGDQAGPGRGHAEGQAGRKGRRHAGRRGASPRCSASAR